jgi:hypothetical protein
MKMRFELILAAMAAICLLVVPAFSMPSGNGACGDGMKENSMGCGMGMGMMGGDVSMCRGANGMGHDMIGPFLLMDNLTEEQLNNMTMGELKELKKEKMAELNNMTLGEIKELQQKKMQQQMDKLNNTTIGELKNQCGMKGNHMGMEPEMGMMDGRQMKNAAEMKR